MPLTAPVVALLQTWLAERAGRPDEPLFPTRNRPPSQPRRGRAADQHPRRHRRRALPDPAGKRVHPHVLRHSCAMTLLHAGVDTSVIALWLGHAGVRSTDPYLHADITIKERALAPHHACRQHQPGRYRPPDKMLAFLESL